MKIALFLFLCLASVCGLAQEAIYVVPFQPGYLKASGSVKGLMKKNQFSRDSLMIITNQKILEGLKAKLPESDFRLADSAFFKILADSSGLDQTVTNSHLDVINGVAGQLSTKSGKKNKPKYYDGRNFTPGGFAMAQQATMNLQAKYIVMLNLFEAGTDFEIHFELYDKNFTRIYGDKFTRPSNTSGGMYFSTFLYYFNNFLSSFDEELVKKIKASDAIRQQ